MIKQKKLQKSKNDFSLPKWFYAAIVGVIVLIVYLYLFIIGWVTYATSYIQCGFRQPVYAYSTLGFMGEHGKLLYALPGESKYTIANEINIDNATYYCTENEAQRNGFMHN